MAYESRARSIVKALSWRVFATLITTGVVYFMTGKLDNALQIGLLDTFAKLGLYFGHERMWERIRFGRVRYTDYQI
ncbi:MAG: DUF2061 domain-containing protein [Polyangiaceae bacterium]|nr:DUF2061 domain-containing protein [Myxococcales bacterium]MCB9591004.1 DUF2061 domain-containing protein [Polyangiaceae bacterium]